MRPHASSTHVISPRRTGPRSTSTHRPAPHQHKARLRAPTRLIDPYHFTTTHRPAALHRRKVRLHAFTSLIDPYHMTMTHRPVAPHQHKGRLTVPTRLIDPCHRPAEYVNAQAHGTTSMQSDTARVHKPHRSHHITTEPWPENLTDSSRSTKPNRPRAKTSRRVTTTHIISPRCTGPRHHINASKTACVPAHTPHIPTSDHLHTQACCTTSTDRAADCVHNPHRRTSDHHDAQARITTPKQSKTEAQQVSSTSIMSPRRTGSDLRQGTGARHYINAKQNCVRPHASSTHISSP